MTDENPFLVSNDQHVFTAEVAKPRRSRWLVLVGGGIVVCLLLCCGVGSIVYESVSGSLGRSVLLPDGPIDFESDAALFNDALARTVAKPESDQYGDDPEIAEFIREVMVMSGEGADVPFSADEFAAAIDQHPATGGGLGFLQRIQLKQTLDQYLPAPDLTDEECRVLAVHRVPDQPYAEVDLLTYSGGLHTVSYRWFLVYDDHRWRVYDWIQLEFGRRISAEYANFFVGNGTEQYGYDDAMEKLGSAQTAWENGNRAETKRLMEQVRQMPMLPSDRSVAKLRAAYTWMTVGEYDQALKTLDTIPNPNQLWGVWPAIADCHLNLERYDEALVACERALANTPDNTTVHSILVQVYDGLGEEELAADHAAAALRVCSYDYTNFYTLADYKRGKDLDLLLTVATASDNSTEFEQLFWLAQGDSEWGQSLVTELDQRDGVPVGVRELATASLAKAQENHGEAIKLYLKVIESNAASEFKDHAFAEHVSTHVFDDTYAELFAETPDLERTLSLLCVDAFDDELYSDSEALLAALAELDSRVGPVGADTQPDNLTAYRLAIRGYTHYDLGNYSDTIADLDAAVAIYDQLSGLQTSDNAWIFDSVDYYVADSLLEEGRFQEYVTRYIDDESRMYGLGDSLVASAPNQRESFLNSFEQSEDSIVQIQAMRLKAAQAKEAGDPKACDDWHLQAIAASGFMMSYVGDSSSEVLVTERAKDLVWHRVEPAAALAPLERQLSLAEQQRHYTAALIEAARLHDTEMMDTWAAGVEPFLTDFEDSQRIAIRRTTGRYWRDIGNIDEAIRSYTDGLKIAAKSSTWEEDSLRTALLDTLVAGQRWQRLSTFGAIYPRQGEAIDPAAIADLANGNSDALMKRLASVDADEVAEWLGATTNLRLLGEHSGQPWVKNLLQRSPVAIPYLYGLPSGRLLFPAGESPTKEDLTQTISDALGSAATVTRLTNAIADDDTVQWVVTTADGQRFGVVDRSIQYETAELPDALAGRLSGPVRSVAFETLDGQHSGHQRMTAVVRAVAQKGAFLFQGNLDSRFWFGDELSSWLVTDANSPRYGSMPGVDLVVQSTDDDDTEESSENPEDGYIGVEYWKQKLEESDGPYPVVFTFTQSRVSEEIPAELVGVADDGYRIIVRLKTQSRLHPALMPDVKFRCRSNSLRTAPD